MTLKTTAISGAVGLVGLAGWLWYGMSGREVSRFQTEPAATTPAAPASLKPRRLLAPSLSPGGNESARMAGEGEGSVAWEHAQKQRPMPEVTRTGATTPLEVSRPLEPASTPPRVRSIIDARQDYWSRLALVHQLPTDLSPSESASLCEYLRLPQIGDDKTRAGEHVLRNDLLNNLRKQTTPHAGLASLLIGISQDHSQDPVMRTYALQHLGLSYPRAIEDTPSHSVPESELVAMRQALWDALNDPDPSVSGTALLTLHHLSTAHPEFEAERVNAAALKFARDESCGPLARSTAMQVCAERRLAQALPSALNLSQDDGNIPLQISAIAALGSLGGEAQMAFLEQLATGDNERLHAPARSALRRLQQPTAN